MRNETGIRKKTKAVECSCQEGKCDQCLAWLDIDEQPETSLRRELSRRGEKFLPPGQLDEKELKKELQRLTRVLANLHVFLFFTDHLSDRQLYEKLWHRELSMKTWLPCSKIDDAMHIDMCGSGSEEDINIYLKHYADSDIREQWAKDFPDMLMPMPAPLPHDRDRFLPQREELSRRFARSA